MTTGPSEVTAVHTRLLKCALEVEDARAYWSHAGDAKPVTAQRAFDEYWFGARSLSRIEVLLTNMRARFDAFPGAFLALSRWCRMAPDTRRLVCHWHLQLADPLYRLFTGCFLRERREREPREITRSVVVSWVGAQDRGRWTMATRIQFASKLLSAAFSAGLIASNRDPRPLAIPRVPDDALEYLMYVLREVSFEGTLLDNHYVASVGLVELISRLAWLACPGCVSGAKATSSTSVGAMPALPRGRMRTSVMRKAPAHRYLQDHFSRRHKISIREWMMGMPIGWTGSEPLATHKFRSWLRRHGKYFREV